ncbi:MBL fold metallo-hydrolase [marine bacterium AO1-C]|nr:MBL fold metallo-hydrolase [marine bacterium AO1-C]
MLKIIKHITFSLGLIGLITIGGLAANQSTNFKVTPIAKNVYSIVSPSKGLPTPENKGWNSNVHFVVTGKGVLLFDTGSSEAIGHKIKKAIQSITDQPVRWIINSHSHADHWLGNAAFTDTATEIITSDQAFATMKKHGPGALKFYARITKGTIGSTRLVYPTLQLTQGQKRTFGDVDVELIFAKNGHSPGDILMWLPKQKIIFGGDVLSSDWMPMITGHGNVPNLIKTLQAIAKLNPSIVLTGHGKATTAKSIKRDADLLSSVWKQVKASHKKGKTLDEILSNVSAKLGSKYSVLYQDFVPEIERHVKLMYKLQQ